MCLGGNVSLGPRMGGVSVMDDKLRQLLRDITTALAAIIASIALYVASVDNPPTVGPPPDPPPVEPPGPPPDPPPVEPPVVTPPPPVTDARLAEHNAILSLVPAEQVTHTSKGESGLWSSPATWLEGTVPGDDARVLIGVGANVTLDKTTARLSWVKVEGTMRLDPAASLELKAETIVCDTIGTLDFRPGGNVLVTFIDRGPIDPNKDPLLFGRGLLALGTSLIHGKPKRSWAQLLTDRAAGESQLTVIDPAGWQPGDLLAISSHTRGEHETATVASISGGIVTLTAPLKFAHKARSVSTDTETPAVTILPFVQNLTRNLTFTSENTAHDRRGHVMFAHSQSVDVRHAAFNDLGRTRKDVPVTDPSLHDPTDTASRLNPRGRYPVHVHRTLGDKHSQPATIIGCAVTRSAGWGIANHSSHVIVEDCVTYDILGAHLTNEIGDELGAWRRNATLHSTGAAPFINLTDDHGNNDWGYGGSGAWFEGGGGTIDEGNVHSGHNYACVYMASGAERKFKKSNLWFDHPHPGVGEFMDGGDVPLRVSGLTCFGNREDFIPWAIHNPHYHTVRSEVKDCTFTGSVTVGYAFEHNWTRNKFLGGFADTGFAFNHAYTDCHVESQFYAGTDDAIDFNGGYINGEVIVLNAVSRNFPSSNKRRLKFDGNQRFGPHGKIALRLFDWWERGAIAGPEHADYLRIFTAGIIADDEIKFADKFLFFPYEKEYSFQDWLGLPAERRVTTEQNQAAGFFFGARQIPADAERMTNGNGWWSTSPALESR